MRYYRHWDQMYPSEVNEFPLLTNGPFKLLTICGLYLIFIYSLPRLLRNTAPKDLRPWLVVQNGVCFGFIVIGSVILLILTGGGRDLFSTEPYTGFLCKTIRRLAYCYMLTLPFRSLRLVMSILRKKDRAVMAYALNYVFILLWTYCGSFEPHGAILTTVLMDLLSSSAITAYLILASPGKYFRPSATFKQYIMKLEMLKFSSIILHAILIQLTATISPIASITAIGYGMFGLAVSKRELDYHVQLAKHQKID